MTRNPHPEAGDAKKHLEVGAMWVCIPCLVKNRSDWSQRALAAESELRTIKNIATLNSLVSCQALRITGLPESPKKPLVIFVQNNYIGHITGPIAQYAIKNNIAVEDRSCTNDFDPDNCGIDWSQYGPVLAFGSVQFISKISRSSIGKYLLYSYEENFSAEYWAKIFSDRLLNVNGRKITADKVADYLKKNGRLHVRPDVEHKAFVGKVHDDESWEVVRQERNIADDLECWISPYRDIQTEWRCWVVDGKVISISQYRNNGKPDVRLEDNPAIYSVATDLSFACLPQQCVVMDMALVDGEYKIIEFNPIHGSGWYDVEIDKVMDALVEWTKNNW